MRSYSSVNKNYYLYTVYVVFVFVAFVVLSVLVEQDEREKQTQYCHMVSLWQADAARGIPERLRAGWPPYRGTDACE